MRMAEEPQKDIAVGNVELEEIGRCKRRIRLTVPSDEVEKEFDATYREVRDTAQIPGFRPGKAPRHIVEMRMGKAFRETVLSRIQRQTVGQVVVDRKLKPVSVPQFENVSYERGKPFTFDATMEVMPDITLPEYKGIKIERREPDPVTDAEVEEELDFYRENAARLEEVKDRALRDGDYAVITYDEEADGQTEHFEKRIVEIAEDSLLPGFAEEVRGMRPDEEREFQVQLPGDYADKEAAGKTVNYRLQLREIKARVLPEADDAFAKKMGFESLEAFKKHIQKKLTESMEKEAEEDEINQIATRLLRETDFEVPQSLVAAETRSRLRRKIVAASQAGVTAEEIRKRTKELIHDAAGEAYTTLKMHIIIMAIAESEGIKVSDAEVEARLDRIASAMKMDKDTLKKRYGEENLVDDARYDILEERVVSFLHNSAVKE